MSQDKIAKYLENRIREIERKIKELTEELEILKHLATTISSTRQDTYITSYSDEVKVAQQEKIRVIYVEEEIVANEIISDGTIKIVLRGGIRSGDEVVTNFLLKILEELKEKKDISDYRLKESGGYITQIDLLNPTSIALRQVEIALKYVWSKHSSS
ncbi:MAG: hypothetical protein RMI56_06305 [Sulfolobales archaeon]|nr:hypothetical protein [Sulfolobales archaeon]MDW8083386.1 hypothetical protein [Sulfolobales archaeon]